MCHLQLFGAQSVCPRSSLTVTLCSTKLRVADCSGCRVGTTFQGKYSDSIKAAYVYPSSNFLDDLTWAAAWLYRKTGEQQFLQACY